MNKELMQAIKDHLTPDAVAFVAEAIMQHCETGPEAKASALSEARWFARGLRVCVLGEKSKPMPSLPFDTPSPKPKPIEQELF